MLSRNAAVYRQLANDYLRAVDVAGDGTCYFRALSFCIHGNQRSHASLRALIASHVKRQAETAATEDKATLLKRAADIATDRFWPGEDIVLATAFCLQRAIVVYVAHGSSSPLTYSPLTASGKPPLTLAFFEPGHYMAVVQWQAHILKSLMLSRMPCYQCHANQLAHQLFQGSISKPLQWAIILLETC